MPQNTIITLACSITLPKRKEKEKNHVLFMQNQPPPPSPPQKKKKTGLNDIRE